MATKMAADAASETRSRAKKNAFLDKTNEEFFKPSNHGGESLIVSERENSG